MAGLLLVTGFLTACGTDEDPPAPTTVRADPVAAAELLADLVTAVEQTADEDVDGAPSGDWPAYLLANADAARIVDFAARLVDEDQAVTASLPAGQWAAAVDLSWRFDGRDPFTAHAEVTFVFDGAGDDVRLVDVGGGGRVSPLWLTGPVSVAERPNALVLVAGEQQPRAELYAALARRAVRAVTDELPAAAQTNRQQLVVEVPSGDVSLETVLNVERGSYEKIAAVTTMVDGTTAPGSPVHVFVNDVLYSDLAPRGAQVVMTHEMVHVVTGAASELNLPLWLVEGFADYVALADSDLPLSVAAAQIIAQVRADGLPDSLPKDADFDSRTTHLGAAYEAAWLVCRVLAEHGEVADIADLQERLGRGEGLNRALQATHGLSVRELVNLWRDELGRISQ